MIALPDADYVVLGSRIALGLDGGFAIAVAARLRLLMTAGAPGALMLSVDLAPPEVHAAQRQAFVERGLVPSIRNMRNLFDEAVADPSWLHAVGDPGNATPGVEYRTVKDAAGRPVVSVPVFEGDPEWHLRDAAVVVHAPDGNRVMRGFRSLYVAWLQHVAGQLRAASADPDRRLVVICESRQIGELLVEWSDPSVRIVHAVYNSHLPSPYDDPDAPLDGLWRRWLAVLDRFDAVLWPTASQRDDVIARFGGDDMFTVVPNLVELGREPVAAALRDPRLVVMVNRLVDQKRVDRAVRAWPRVLAAVPDARLDIYGDGPLRDALQALIGELELAGSVRLRGQVDDLTAVLDRAAVYLTSSAFEGQSVALAEALARGLPVVSFDVRYGPRDVVGAGGVLVPPGDVGALADAVVALLRDDERRAAMSVAAREAARALAPDVVRGQMTSVLLRVLSRPSRRAARSGFPTVGRDQHAPR